MTGIYAIIGIVMLVFGILQIVLFFKLWGMTNDVGQIKGLLSNLSTQKATAAMSSHDLEQNSLAHPQALGGDLQQLVVRQELQTLLQAHNLRRNKKPNKKLSGNGPWELLLFIRLRGNRCASRKSRPTINMCAHKVILLGGHMQRDV